MILHSMQSANLDDKSSPRAYPRDEIAAQARFAERLNNVGFWQASHRLSEVRELRDACGEGYIPKLCLPVFKTFFRNSLLGFGRAKSVSIAISCSSLALNYSQSVALSS